ncbi:MAG: 50S ribosomal protein L18 [candidate division Zixibacteria bacterium]|nr:50S ribosomal protein L18 [candidate division Zixibacteria bacterium]
MRLHKHTNSQTVMRVRRHTRVRKTVEGTSDRPRLCVFRSLKHIYAQVVDDTTGATLAASSTVAPEVREKLATDLSKLDESKIVGQALAEKALASGISKVTFDRGGYRYHGRIKALADGAREKGLEF